MNKTTLKWRLSNLPSVAELRQLVEDEVITREEAREILFRSETEEDRDKKSLESEIKFLRDLVEKLSASRSQIITTIREVKTPYYIQQPWYRPYEVWCGATTTAAGSVGNYTVSASAIDASGGEGMTSASNFSDINTF